MLRSMLIVPSLLPQWTSRERNFKKWCVGVEEEAKEAEPFCQTMLVHSNMMNISLFSNRFFTRKQTREDVCTERNKLEKKSIFTFVWSSNSSSQKFVLQPDVNISTWFYLSFSCIANNTLLLLASKHQQQSYFIKTLVFIACLLSFDMKTNIICFIVNILIWNRILTFVA